MLEIGIVCGVFLCGFALGWWARKDKLPDPWPNGKPMEWL